jgi:hypothetical protein
LVREEEMFNSTIFDVVVGLVSVFLAMSLFTSALTEGVSTILNLRARTLLSGIKQLLNDPKFDGLALDLYNHALINPLSNGATNSGSTPSIKPSYIQPQHFALALIDTMQRTAGQAATLEQSIDKITDPQIKATLQTLYQRAEGKIELFREQVAQWFDSAMDRLTGVYKRWTKLISFLIALFVAALFNADPIHLVDTLWQRPPVAAQLAKLDLPTTIDPNHPESEALPNFLRQIESAGPLLGWSGFAHDTRAHGAGLALMLLGWLVAAGAALFGAPFWFDVLQRFVQLRGTGRSPRGAAATRGTRNDQA